MQWKIKTLRGIIQPSCLLLAGLMLASCAGSTLRTPFRNYNRAYADTLNEQMLLNLARLHNGHPPYFLAVGTINNRFNFSADVNAGGEVTETSADTASRVRSGSSETEFEPGANGLLGVVGRTLTRTAGATIGAATGTAWKGIGGGRVGASNTPDFQLIPLNNDIVAKQFLEPISTEVFTTLYQQGFPMDQLMRILIERVEITLPDGDEMVLSNSPTAGSRDSYANFLGVCALLRDMQRNGDLILDEKREPSIIGTLPGDKRPKAKDLTTAHERKLSYKQNAAGDWELIEKTNSSSFSIRQGRASGIKQRLSAEEITHDRKLIDHVVNMLNEGVVVRGKAERDQIARSKLVLRSYSRAMESAAVEQDAFDVLMKDEHFRSIVPDQEEQPILRTIWKGQNGKLTTSLQSVSYAGNTYEIRDRTMGPLDPTVRWNRDTFRVLVGLGSQVAVDISKFQRQVLELR
jgi:hypothetical protein